MLNILILKMTNIFFITFRNKTRNLKNCRKHFHKFPKILAGRTFTFTVRNIKNRHKKAGKSLYIAVKLINHLLIFRSKGQKFTTHVINITMKTHSFVSINHCIKRVTIFYRIIFFEGTNFMPYAVHWKLWM